MTTQPDLETLLSRARALEPAAQYDEALQDLDAVLSRARAEGSRSFEAAALHHRGRILRIRGELAQAEDSVRQAAALFSDLGDRVGQAQALLVQGEIFSDLARFRDFEDLCRDALEIGRAATSPLVEARALTLLGTAQVLQGRADEARVQIDAGVEVYQRTGDRRGAATSLLMLGRVDHMRGRLADASRSVEQALGIFEELGETRATTAAAFSLGQIGLERGVLEQAGTFAQRGLALTEDTSDVVMQLRCMLLLAQIRIEGGQAAEALEGMQRAEALCQGYDLASILPEILRVTAQAQIALGQGVAAEQSARRGIAETTEDDVYSQGTTRLVLALALEALGRNGEADLEFVRAVGDLDNAEETYEIGWSHLAYAQFLINQNRRDQGREHLAEALRAFSALEAAGRVAFIKQLMG